MTLKVTQGHMNCRCATYNFVILLCSNTACLYYHIYRVRDCLWPWEVLHFRKDRWNYKPYSLSDLCKRFVDNACYILRGMVVTKISSSKSDLQVRPSRSLKVIGTVAIRQATYHLLLVFNCNYVCIFHRFRDIFSKTWEVTWHCPRPF